MKSTFLNISINGNKGNKGNKPKPWSKPPPPKKEKYNFLDKSPLIKHIEREIIRKHGDNIFRDEEFEQFCLNKK